MNAPITPVRGIQIHNAFGKRKEYYGNLVEVLNFLKPRQGGLNKILSNYIQYKPGP